MRRRIGILLLLCLAYPAVAQPANLSTQLHRVDRLRHLHRRKTLPLTVHSKRARLLFQQGMIDFVNLQTAKAMDEWRQSAKRDPNFALAHINICFNSKDPAEQSAELAKAKALERHVTRGERLFIRWVAGVRENNYVAGIQAMNDLVAMYPRDKQLLYVVGNWLVFQESYDQARKLMERALAVDPKYPPALNDLGYAYALTRNYKEAIAAMERYVAALPGEPNPQDSYAEVLRLSGDFPGALQHYQAALKIDPKFVYSQLGIADTYALMGDQARARSEYAKAIAGAESDADRVEFEMQSAITYVREHKYEQADTAFAALANEAHSLGLEFHEAEVHRMMAMYEPDTATALKHLTQAEGVLDRTTSVPKSDRDEELARVLRWRVARAGDAGDQAVADEALRQLHTMAASSNSHAIRHAEEAASGARLVQQGKYQDAVPHLQEDHDNAFSMKLLAEAYVRTGATAEAEAESKLLKTLYAPTMDQA
ncbi:MAG TPA: tetratricopeptide repeat protein, partial [Terriglobales bacterium]|nr:tetratricopeptide repeat protein [Terriglobales bacterium]